MTARRDVARTAEVLAAVAVAVAALIVFSPGLVGPFLWDDKALILGNAHVRGMDVRAWFTRDFWDVGGDPATTATRLRYFRPLVTASYALEYRIGGADPFVFHLSNLVAHAVVSLLAFVTLLRWTALLAPATLGALLFALHPTRAENVAWISGRTDVLSALGVLVALLGVARRLRGARFAVPLEAAGTALAYLTKEGAVVLPAFVAFEAWIAAGRPGLDRATLIRMTRAAAPQLVLAILYLAARARWLPIRPASAPLALVDRAQFFLESVGRYVALVIAPYPLSSQHGLLRVDGGRYVHHLAFVVAGAVVLALLIALAALARRRAPSVTMAVALFLGALLPVSNVIVAGMSTLVAERFLYLPLLPVAFLAAAAFARARRDVSLAVATPVTLILALAAFDRAVDFTDERRFWSRERALHPESLEARRTLMGLARDARRYREALWEASEGRVQAARWYPHLGAEAEFTHHVVELRAELTPDRAVNELDDYAGFFRALLFGAPIATVRAGGPPLALLLEGPVRDRARALRPRTMLLLASLESRLGRDDRAVPLAIDAHGACRGCVQFTAVASRVLARTGDYPRAYAFVDAFARDRGEEAAKPLRAALQSAELARKQAAMASGPIELNLRATELAALEAYGRAYAVLAPHRAQVELAPGFAIGFAELAFRAGEPGVAREVLSKHVPADRVDPMLTTWAQKMGWGD